MEPQIVKAILRTKNKAGGVTFPDSRQYYKAAVVKIASYWHRNRHTDNGTEYRAIHLRTINLQQGGTNIQRGKDILFSKWCWESQTVACKSVKLEHTLTLYTKINSKWLKNLNIRQDTIKFLKENIGKTFSDINCTNVFLSQCSKAMEIKAKTNQRELIKLASF